MDYAIRRALAKTCTHTHTHTHVLKTYSDVLGPIVAKPANLLFDEGRFQGIFKVGQVIPLLKKPGADAEDMNIELSADRQP